MLDIFKKDDNIAVIFMLVWSAKKSEFIHGFFFN